MIEMRLSDLAEKNLGSLVGDDVHFSGISIDSRSLQQGNLFVAIQGPNF